jgi:hypothetical protein
MTDQHPITPPPELVKQWRKDWHFKVKDKEFGQYMAERGAQWGADQELEACCEWLADETPTNYINALRAARRPKPPSLKEQALGLLNEGPASDLLDHEVAVIRRALEALPDE